MEVGTHSPWVSRFLQELGLRVIVANPRKLIKGQIGDQAFQSAVLFFQLLKPPQFAHSHSCIPLLPVIQGGFADPEL